MMHIAKGGAPWVLGSVAVTLLCLGLVFLTIGMWFTVFCILSVFSLVISCLLVVFFRDPERIIGSGIIAVADGVIQDISTVSDPEVGDCVRVSTFMNIHNVHVNRAPIDGTIIQVLHHPGGHVPAFRKDSERNERVVTQIQSEIGVVKVVQIAGTLARRIVPYVSEGDVVKKGGKLGLIRLGSRVDVYLPRKKIKPLTIQVRSKIKAGVDTIAQPND